MNRGDKLLVLDRVRVGHGRVDLLDGQERQAHFVLGLLYGFWVHDGEKERGVLDSPFDCAPFQCHGRGTARRRILITLPILCLSTTEHKENT